MVMKMRNNNVEVAFKVKEALEKFYSTSFLKIRFLQWRLRKKNSKREYDSKNPIKRRPWWWLRVNFWFSHPILFLSPICRTLILYVYAWYAIILKHSDKLLSHNLRIFVKKKEKEVRGTCAYEFVPVIQVFTAYGGFAESD